MNELISVIIPVYNVEPYLERCLRSVADNTYKFLEVICINDGSTDGSAAILQHFAHTDRRFKVITSKNEGLSAARNKGLDAATGAYIAFIDSDDAIHPMYFESMISCISKYACDIAICGFSRPTGTVNHTRLDPDNLPVSLLNLEQIYATGNLKGYVWGKLYPTTLVKNSKFLEKRGIIEDILFNAEVFAGIPDLQACYISYPLYHYYDNPGSLVHQISYGGMLDTAEAYFSLLRHERRLRVKRILIIEAMKLLLSMRYWIRRGSDHTYLGKCSEMLKTAVTEFSSLPNAAVREKVSYQLMYRIPSVYSFGKWLTIAKHKMC